MKCLSNLNSDENVSLQWVPDGGYGNHRTDIVIDRDYILATWLLSCNQNEHNSLQWRDNERDSV